MFFCTLQLLTNHYERCWKYYCLPNGWANFGVASEEELHLTRKLFWGIFESLAHKVELQQYEIFHFQYIVYGLWAYCNILLL